MVGNSDDAEKAFGLKGKVPSEFVKNVFVDNGDGTVTDRATRLTWQQSGSDMLSHGLVSDYIDTLNRNRFTGRDNWRLPTINELVSLLEPDEQENGLYIHPIFGSHMKWCWSCDMLPTDSAWAVDFYSGEVYWVDLHHFELFVRAVCSMRGKTGNSK